MEPTRDERASGVLLVVAWLAVVLVLATLVGAELPVPEPLAPRQVTAEPLLLLGLLLALVRRAPSARALLVSGTVVCWLATVLAAGDWIGALRGVQGDMGSGEWMVVTTWPGASASWVTTAVCLLLAVLVTVLAVDARRGPGGPAAPVEGDPDDDPAAPGATPELERRPTWEPGEASGAVWRRAEDAARGADPDRAWEDAGDDRPESDRDAGGRDAQ